MPRLPKGDAPVVLLSGGSGSGVFRRMIDAVIAPENAQQIYTPPNQPPPAPRLDDIDRRIIEAVRDVGPVKMWSLLNWLAEDEGARSRTGGRVARLNLLDRFKRLKRLGLVFGHGRNEIAATKPMRQQAKPQQRRRNRTVGRSPRRTDQLSGIYCRQGFDQQPRFLEWFRGRRASFPARPERE